MKPQTIPLGTLVCERTFRLYTSEGQPQLVVVRLGRPVRTSLDGHVLGEGEASCDTFRCPVQITGLSHDERIDGIFGEDPFVALQYAIEFIGERLEKWSAESGLINLHKSASRDSWIWTYPPHQGS